MPSYYMPVWKRAPFVSFLFPLITGIVAGWYIVIPLFNPLIAILIFILILSTIYLVFRVLGKKLNNYAGIGIFFLLLLFGCFLSWWHNDNLRPDFAGHFFSDSSFIKVQLESPLTEKKKSWGADAKILDVMNGKVVRATRGNVILYFKKSKEKPDLKYGDILLVSTRMNAIKNLGNPGGFDYKRYCRTKNIWYSAYLRLDQWKLLERGNGSKLHTFFIEARMNCVRILKRYISSKREVGVAEALLLGYRKDLDPELVRAYANVGVVHLIAISGLHIGLIYLVLIWLFRILQFRHEVFKGILICIFLWGFALLTGARPSTLRATIMFTFLVAGKYFLKREVDTFNILAASAFVLLCINPFLLFDVGFQLSYLAVAGIFIFQRPICDLFWFKNKIANYCWQMMSVSISAQILVFPIALFYFHQFPVFFLLGNLLLIPVATVVLYGEIILLSVAIIPAVAKIIGFVITKLLVFINGSVLWANSYSFIHWEYYNLTLFKLFLLYALIVLIGAWLFRKNKRALVAATVLIVIFGITVMLEQRKIIHRKKAIVYQTTGYTSFELVNGRSSRYYCNDSILHDPGFIKYILKPSGGSLNIRYRDMRSLSESFFILQDKKFVILHKAFSPDSLKGVLPVDYVIVSKYNRLTMKEIVGHFSPLSIVLDASVKAWQRKKWKTACKQLNLHCFSVPDQGAWILSLK